MSDYLRFDYDLIKDRYNVEIPNIDLVIDEAFVAGGAVRRVVSGDRQDTDVDLYFRSAEGKLRQSDVLSNHGFHVSFENNWITQMERDSSVIQLISFGKPVTDMVLNNVNTSGYYSTAESLIDVFDFTICQFALDMSTNEIVCAPQAIFDLQRRSLVVHEITYPVASLRRLLKYTAQEFKSCDGTLRMIAESCKNTNINLEVRYIY